MTRIRSAIFVGILAVLLFGTGQRASLSASNGGHAHKDSVASGMRRYITNAFGPGRSVAPGEQPDTSPYGVNPFVATDHTCDLMTEMGVKWVRLHPKWEWIEPVEGQFHWETEYWGGVGRLDTWIPKLNERGFKVSVCVGGPPAWALQPDSELPIPEKMAAFCTALAQRYNGKIACFEILNEENTLATRDRDKQASSYVPILRACYQAIKAVNPNNLVACAGMWGPHSSSSYMTYLGDLYRAGAKNYFDVANIHFYTGNDDAEDPRNQLRFALAHLRWVMSRNGDEKKTVWITEFGYAVPNDGQNDGKYNEAQQAAYLRDTLDICRESGIVSRVFWYQLRNDDGMALVHTHYAAPEGSDDHKRPAYNTYKSYIAQYPSWPSKDIAKPWQVDRAGAISIKNAGFENGTTGWYGDVERDVTRAHSGLASGKVSIEGKETGANQIVTLDGSGWYLLTGYVRADPGVGARLAVSFTTNTVQNSLGHWNTNTVLDPVGAGSTWQMVQIALAAPAGSKKAVIYILAHSGRGDVWFDDIELVPYHEAAAGLNFARD